MKNIPVLFATLLFLSACAHKAAALPSPSSAISASILGHTLTISSSSRSAGAICPLNWNGKEFIDQHGHGRELQSAASFDGLGECYNPTEAVSEAGGAGIHLPANFCTVMPVATKIGNHQLLISTNSGRWHGMIDTFAIK